LESLGVLRASLKRSVIQKTIDQIDFASDGSIMVLDGDGKFVVGDSSFAAPELLSRIMDRQERLSIEPTIWSIKLFTRNLHIPTGIPRILPQSALRHELLPLQTSTFFVTLMFLFLGLVLARILSDNIARPLGGMVTALGTLSIGDFSVRLPEDRQDEIGHLRAGFNQMIVKIETLVDDVYRKEVLKKNRVQSSTSTDQSSFPVQHFGYD
jgi:two-component system sensor histidine kinase YesM